MIYGLLIFLYLDDSVHEFLEEDLAHHMIFEHSLFFLMGALSVKIFEIILKIATTRSSRIKDSDLQGKLSHIFHKVLSIVAVKWANILRVFLGFKGTKFLLFLIAITLLIIWHIPSIFDLAVIDEDIHFLQHLSFVSVGASAYLSIRLLGDSFKILVTIVLGSMMSSMGIIFVLLNNPIFTVYSVESHNYAGTFMVISGLLILLVFLPIFLIRKTIAYVNSRM